MRRFYSFMVAALAVIAAASCNKEIQETPQNSEKETVTFTAFVDGADTKTVLDGKVSKWEAGDAITILNNDEASEEYTTQNEGTAATFSGKALSGNKLMAVYPAEYDNHEYFAWPEEKVVIAHIPVDQPSREGSYSKNAALAVAYTEDNTLAFKNATTLLKFTVKGTDVKKVIFYGHNNEAVSGDVEVELDGNNKVSSVKGLGTDRVEGDETVHYEKITWAELWADDEANEYCFTEGITYYLAVIPQVYENGFSLQFEFDGGGKADVLKYNEEYELKPNTILNVGELEYIAPETTETVYLKPTVWDVDGAWYAAHFWGTGGASDVKMTDSDQDGIYEAEVPAGMQSVLFCRMNPEFAEFGWDVTEGETVVEDHVWNKTADLTVPADDVNCHVITGWDSSEWMTLEDAADYVYVNPEDLPLTMEIRGSWDSWTDGVPMTEEGDYYTIKGRSFTAGTEFKFTSSKGGWYGASGAVSINTALPVGGDNIIIPTAGTYDLYIAKTLDMYYIMTSGQEPVKPDTYRFYVQNNVGWTKLNFYAWEGYSTGAWPGIEMTKSASVAGYGECKYAEIPKGSTVVNFIINNGSGAQTNDQKVSGNSNVKALSNGDYVYVLKDSDVK